ncbi:hypothetical protein V6Z12_D03G202600 [Gossypium hirsutum]
MGNVNGREDGNNSPSGIEEEETRANSALEAMAAPMGHSPPHSPTSTHSPLMFTPQPNPIHVAWDNWKTRIPLQRCGKDFTIMKVLPSGVYQYRFIVDGQWRYAPDLPWAQDGTGNANNILDLQVNLLSLSWYGIRSFRISNYLFSLNTRDFAKEPPLVPPHVQLPLLNLPASYEKYLVYIFRLHKQGQRIDKCLIQIFNTHQFFKTTYAVAEPRGAGRDLGPPP